MGKPSFYQHHFAMMSSMHAEHGDIHFDARQVQFFVLRVFFFFFLTKILLQIETSTKQPRVSE